MGSYEKHPFTISSIAVIGAGPCGLAAAKYLLAQNAFQKIDIYEQQPEVGGVWYYSPSPPQTLPVPQVKPDCPPDPPLPQNPPVFPSPMYELLHTNIPRGLMRFSDLPIPEPTPIYPRREHIQEYLVEYSKEVRHLIQFSSQVVDVRLRRDEGDGKERWDVEVLSLRTSEKRTTTYDAVVVASGHYATIYIPNVPGITDFHAAHPGVITHSKHYRNPTPFTGKKVVVVGNAASGLDIASQINTVCRKPVLLSVQHPTPEPSLQWCGAEEVPVIEEFLPSERGIRFSNGRVEHDIDAVIFATGYLYAYPFLSSLTNPPIVTDGRRVCGLYQHIFRIDQPTLAFIGLPIKVVPFPVAESQAALVARTWANLLPLPSVEVMRKWEEDEEKARQEGKFHVWGEGEDSRYINEVWEAIERSGTPGKKPPRWSPEQVWQRTVYGKAKLAFELGGRTATSLEELGFVYPGEGE